MLRYDNAGGSKVVSDRTYNDGIRLLFGTDSDVVRVHDSAGRAAGAAYAGVLVGTPVYANAIPANSLIESNVTADGDFVWFTNTGGNSIEGMRLDASARQMLFPTINDPATPTIGFGDGTYGFYGAAAGEVRYSSAGVDVFRFNATGFNVEAATGGVLFNRAASATQTAFAPNRADDNTGLGSAAADQLSHIAGGFEMLRLTENTALANYVAALFDAPDQVDLTSANGSTWRMFQTQAVNVDWDGGVLITALDGQGLFINAITNTADQATTATDVSTVSIAAPIAGTNMTHTRDYSLDLLGSTRFRGSIFAESTPTEGTAGEQLQSAGTGAVPIWAAAASQRENKIIHDEWAIPQLHDALDTIINTPVYRFNYAEGKRGTGDFETEYVGVMADEAPWAMHYGGSVVNPVNTLGYMVLGMRALEQENTDLRERVAVLEAK